MGWGKGEREDTFCLAKGVRIRETLLYIHVHVNPRTKHLETNVNISCSMYM